MHKWVNIPWNDVSYKQTIRIKDVDGIWYKGIVYSICKINSNVEIELEDGMIWHNYINRAKTIELEIQVLSNG
jgi:hypothetical protein